MSTFLVTWNPDSYTSLAKRWEVIGKEIAESGSSRGIWSTGSRMTGIEEEDQVFMVRQSRERGLVLAGVFESEIYQAPHWIEVEAAKGKTANYADVRWEQQTDLDGELPIEVLLARVPEVPWNVLLGSGVRVPDEAESKLHKLWDAHIGKEKPSQTNPNWSWDEEILAFDVYLRFGAVGRNHEEVIGLSKLLRLLSIHSPGLRSPTFRNPNSVSRKLGDIQSHRPGYFGKPTSGSRLDKEIWKAYTADPGRLEELAKLIRSCAAGADTPEADEVEIDELHREGRLVYRMHRQRERDPKLRRRKIAQVKKDNMGKLMCEACDSDLESTYGSPGAAIFECHHIEPLHVTGSVESTLEDVALLCPNCHRVAHRLDPWPTLEELRGHIS